MCVRGALCEFRLQGVVVHCVFAADDDDDDDDVDDRTTGRAYARVSMWEPCNHPPLKQVLLGAEKKWSFVRPATVLRGMGIGLEGMV